MRQTFGKSLLISLLSISCLNTAFADNTTPQQTGDATNAIAFAIQAGQIAGTAQACGINISTFTTRVSEAINKLALNPTDSTAATNSFQQTLQQAQTMENQNHAIACSQVNQDFNGLPLMRPDYEQSVIAQLNPAMTGAQTNTNTNANTAAPATSGNPASAASSNTATAVNTPNQQNLTNQPAQNNNAANANTNAENTIPPNPAYPKQNYGTSSSFSTNFQGAIKPYGMANMPQSQSQTQNNYSTSNNPPPPSFSNPNNAPQQ